MSHYFLGAGVGGGVTSREASGFGRQGEPCSHGGEGGKRLFDAGRAGFAVARGEICSAEAAGGREGHGAVSTAAAGGSVPRTGMFGAEFHQEDGNLPIPTTLQHQPL